MVNDAVLSANEREELGLLGFHELGRRGFEIEAEERFGIGRADIEPPVGIVDFESVELVLGAISIALAECSEYGILVVHFAVDLTGVEIALGFGDERGDRLAGLGHEVEEKQSGQRAGLGDGVLFKIVVARELTGEDGSGLAHLLLDEGVTDPAFERAAAVLLDEFLDGAGRTEIIEDGSAGLLFQDFLSEEGSHEVHRDRQPGLIDESDAVGVAVVGDTEVGRERRDLRTELVERLNLERIGFVCGKRMREIIVEPGDREIVGELLVDRELEDAHGIGGVDDDGEMLLTEGGKGGEIAVVGWFDIFRSERTFLFGGFPFTSEREIADRGEAARFADGDSAAEADLHTIVFRGVV